MESKNLKEKYFKYYLNLSMFLYRIRVCMYSHRKVFVIPVKLHKNTSCIVIIKIV